MSKNCPGGLQAREFASAGRINEPLQIAAIRRLLEKLHPDIDRIFQQALLSVHMDKKVWFMRAPVGDNLLDNMLPRLSETYTDRSLQATTVTAIKKAKFSNNDICAVTGQKNPLSLRNFSHPDGPACR